ncbi:mechanosensitive ion channel family protein [Campylobacter sputorum subsp. bubulus]|uniref:Mechanosensitive ion channel family protein n=1 Tax=Campylobacter sputorum subsp. sputorum TaxID=32024 RepID=A0A381DKE3_9BACT|nr:mechanosensitive ion channel domain-containing protein [Campylobacter sputorum]ASM34485.1 mechanosensitive ion channel family protein [Campylobacter sputorum aubsp. sputorum RM3237]KAB0582127.1 mechanosensitive ion channel [Campylobacter sputorum subsp. sputorum]QEL04676.1 mechanosensitive ion channel family protein [Campylobacter sputorum subsp. sputorum]SUX09516.1 mechanosensitive ion channel family protein [Campylobacter sputorum subsp. bubulus]SUX11149.1 mechanosensitive ion channel fam
MKKILILFAIFFISLAYSETNTTFYDKNTSLETLENLQSSLKNIDNSLKDNIWFIRYSNFNAYQKMKDEAELLASEIKKNSKNEKVVTELEKNLVTLNKQMEVFKEFEKSPFVNMTQPTPIEDGISIKNPFDIISGFSAIKRLNSQLAEYTNKMANLQILISKFEEKKDILLQIENIAPSKEISNLIQKTNYYLNEFNSANDIMYTTLNVYEKQVNETIHSITKDMKEQATNAFSIAILIFIIIAVSFLFKYIAKKYIDQNERVYTANKIINFINVTLIVIILLFAYIENVTYLVTVLGFASAGLAIAMKDMFMSLLGWIVVVFGGTYHVGDRIKVRRDGENIVGDIIDISLLRITIYEDITLITYKETRRAGRIIFVPNNYIFTDLIANYTHYGMKTVWDGIDIMITFESNHKKAMYIIKNIARKYSKGYTDIAKKEMNKLRSQYSIKNPNVEPRIFSFFEPYGINISVWYMANAYTVLSLRSTISFEIIEAIKMESDIEITYPKQTLFMNKTSKKMPDIAKQIGEELLY